MTDQGQSEPGQPRVIRDPQAMRAAVVAARRRDERVGVVPTMGALHAGHLSLVDACRAACDVTVVTIFVNPTQFAPDEDLEKYPRNLQADLDALATRGVQLVFAPEREALYRPGFETYVEVGPVGRPLEGAARPHHFRGVATIVLKLFQIVPADVAFFGQKDYQQTLVVQRMIDDFDLPIALRVCPIVREPDGLALSSRNRYLSSDERARALSLSEGLALAAELVARGERNAAVIVDRVRAHLESSGVTRIDYVALVRDRTVEPATTIEGPSVLALAAHVGATRLIDNRRLEV